MPFAAWQFLVKVKENTIGLTNGCFTGCDERVVDVNGKTHYFYGEHTKEHLKDAFRDVSQRYEIIGCTYGKITD